MNASKENCRKALEEHAKITDEADFIYDFLKAVEKKLPSEARIAKEAARKKVYGQRVRAENNP